MTSFTAFLLKKLLIGVLPAGIGIRLHFWFFVIAFYAISYKLKKQKNKEFAYANSFGDPCENRTRVTAVKGRCLNRLTNGPSSVGITDSFGNYLLSRAVTHQVSSTWKSLTSVFGMGTGEPSLLSSPNILLKAYTLKTKQQTIPWWFRLSFALRFSLILLLSSLDSLGQALGLLVPVSYTHYCASTSGLSTM